MKTPSRTTARKRTKEPERHRWLDPWLTAKPGTQLNRLTSEAARLIDEEESRRGTRKRQRKEIDDRHHRERVETVVANLAYAVLMPPPTGRLALQLGNRAQGMTRYDNPALGTKPMRVLVNLMEDLDILSLRWSTMRGEVSSVAPAPALEDKARALRLSLADFSRHKDEELIILTRASRSSRAEDAEPNARQRVDYHETRKTRAMRNEMRRLNAFLADQNISFNDDGSEPVVDPFDRTMKRHFVIRPGQPERFDQVGRLFGGFWQTLKSERRKSIRIRGEPVTTLDYSSMSTRLAYAGLRIVPPEGDLYEIEGAQGYRSGIKMTMNTLLFDDTSRRAKWPSAVGIGVGNDSDARNSSSRAAQFDARLPEGWTVGKTKAAILRRHPKLDAAWGKGLGLSLMFMESRILIAVLNELMRRDIPALGLHDGLMVQRSRREITKTVMEEVALRLSGAPIPVSEKT